MFLDKTTDGHQEAVFVGNLVNFRRQEPSMVAAGTWNPPAAWFDTPEPDYPVPLTITDEGHVFGHLAEWQTCHIGFDACVTAPPSNAGYSFFHTGVFDYG